VPQQIVIDKLGRLSSLNFKRKGFNLRRLGRVSIRRCSDIIWNETWQAYYIILLVGRFSNSPVTKDLVFNLLGFPETYMARVSEVTPGNYTLLFDDYDDAVAVEVDVIQGMKAKGFL
jgi:hypothetical protein